MCFTDKLAFVYSLSERDMFAIFSLFLIKLMHVIKFIVWVVLFFLVRIIVLLSLVIKLVTMKEVALIWSYTGYNLNLWLKLNL